MQVIEFIKEKGIDALTGELGIKVKDYPESQVVVLNYCQIKSPKTHPVVMECRGLILEYSDCKTEWRVVCRPFKRFFNWGEALKQQKDFDLSRAVCHEKIDGSLVKVWYNWRKELWEVATRRNAFGETNVRDNDITFCELIFEAFGCDGQHEFNKLVEKSFDKDVTYIFELTSWQNRVITKYEGTSAWYLGALDNTSGKDLSEEYRECAKSIGSKLPNVYTFENIDECLKTANTLPDLREGYVLHDIVSGIRVKVKSAVYVVAHHIQDDGLTQKRIKQLVLTNELEEYLLYYPEDAEHFKHTTNMLALLRLNMNTVYDECRLKSNKEFAIAVKDYCFCSVLFQARRKELAVDKVWNSMQTFKRYNILSKFMGEL